MTVWNKVAWWGSIASLASVGLGLSPILVRDPRGPALTVGHSIALHSVRVEARGDSGFATVTTFDVLAACVELMVIVHGTLDEVTVHQGSQEILRRFELRNDSDAPITNLRLVIYKLEGGEEHFSVSPQVEATLSDYTPIDGHAGRMKVVSVPVLPPKTRAIVSYRVKRPDPGSAQAVLASLFDPTIVSLSAQELAREAISVEPMTYFEMNASETRLLSAVAPIIPFTTTDQMSVHRLSPDIVEIVADSLIGRGGRFACRTPDGSRKPATDRNLFRPDSVR